MPGIHDRRLETSTTVGAGNFSLLGAVTGYRTLAAGLNINRFFPYCIEATDANGIPTGDWEVGYGYMLGDLTTLVRNRVTESSNDDLPVSFAAGTKRVFITDSASNINVDANVQARLQNLAIP